MIVVVGFYNEVDCSRTKITEAVENNNGFFQNNDYRFTATE